MSEWKKFQNDRMMMEHPSGFIIFKPANEKSPVPLFCPVCEMAMHDSDDANAFRKSSCCFLCYVKWAELDRRAWVEGWRPNETIIKDEVQLRQMKRREKKLWSRK